MRKVTRIVIIGAGYAGLTCALRLARDAGGAAQVTLINGSPSFVERIRLHEQAAGKLPRRLDLADMVQDSGVVLRIGWVESVDLQAQTVSLAGETLSWDRLVLALGSQVEVDGVPGIRELAYTLDDGATARLSAALPAVAARAGKLVVVGGGLTGIEAASELAETYPRLSVTLVTRGVLAPDLGEKARAHVRAALARLQVEVREHTTVRALDPKLLRTEQGPIDCDLCIWSAGFIAPPVARGAGLAVNQRGQVWVDAQLRSVSHAAVHVAGDLAVHRDPAGAPVPMGCKSALPTGSHVANNLVRALAGRPEVAFSYRAVPFCLSLGRHDAVVDLTPAHPGGLSFMVRGKLAARLKELICRGTLWALALDRARAAWRVRFRALGMPRLSAGQTADELPAESAESAHV